jgi:hypothetical protein
MLARNQAKPAGARTQTNHGSPVCGLPTSRDLARLPFLNYELVQLEISAALWNEQDFLN